MNASHLLNVFFVKLWLNIKAEAAKTKLNYAWWVLEPTFLVVIFYLVFGVFLANAEENFFVFLLCGNIPFFWFSRSVMNSSGSIMAGRGLINQMAIPKPFFPLLVVFQDLVKQFFVFTLFLSAIVVLGVEVSWNWVYIVFIIITQFLFIVACSLLVSAITPFFPDFKYILDTGMVMLMFGSGIFYSYHDVILEQHQRLFLLNPMANLIENYRRVILDNLPPNWTWLLMISGISMLLTVSIAMFFKKYDKYYARLAV